MMQNDETQQNGQIPPLLQELCMRLNQETGLEFSPLNSQDEQDMLTTLRDSELVQLKLNIETSVGESTPTEAEYGVPLPLVEVGVSRLDEMEKDAQIVLRFYGEEEEIKLAYLPPKGEVPTKQVSRLLAALGREIYAGLVRESIKLAQTWTWEKLLGTAVEHQWDDNVFEQKATEYDLPMLRLGFPVLICCQKWRSEIPLVIENLLPQHEVFWVYRQELFLFVRAETNETRADKFEELLVWGKSLIQQIHNMLADELGVLASVFVGSPSDRGLWRGYQEVRRLVKLQAQFFPGEAGLAAWKLGLAGLLGEISSAAIQRYRREILKEHLTPELLETLEAYFTHGLSISETARALFIHRNTLLYRLNRVTELTGYNPREFAAAVQLHLAIWLQRHDKYLT